MSLQLFPQLMNRDEVGRAPTAGGRVPSYLMFVKVWALPPAEKLSFALHWRY